MGRHSRGAPGQGDGGEGDTPGGEEPRIICRCNDVTIEDVERAIEEGCRDLDCLRKVLHIGFGPCQGRTCLPLLARILARRLGKNPEELGLPRYRPPLAPMRAGLLEAYQGEQR